MLNSYWIFIASMNVHKRLKESTNISATLGHMDAHLPDKIIISSFMVHLMLTPTSPQADYSEM